MCIATHTDVKNNRHDGSHKLYPGPPFSVALKPYNGAPNVSLYIVASHEYIYAKVKSI